MNKLRYYFKGTVEVDAEKPEKIQSYLELMRDKELNAQVTVTKTEFVKDEKRG